MTDGLVVEDERIEKKEGIEKWRNRRDFNFPRLCLVRGWKSRGIENRICINLLSCLYYITFFLYKYFIKKIKSKNGSKYSRKKKV